MHVLTKVGIILLIIGIIAAAVGIYSLSSLTSSLLSAEKLTNAKVISISPHESFNISYSITVTPSIGVFVYNYTSPILVTLPSIFSHVTSINNEELYILTATSPQSGIIHLYNNGTTPVTVHYEFEEEHITSLLTIGSILLVPGILLAIIGLILIIVGLILGRRKRT
ncbi:hypothetical protein DFR86_10405 [Acidianus sulfidivorans JP7]|uniref:Uncharacterized protein n=1 Tax=Acidianus sulfidivorans JP7 TaxID=619593 RepID=A0A2U9IPJ8_9CREN|nr:hypothetical protein [Acidianus sulfidivorans]AWR97907.1 hypothetical protein DFR86_10405 [Acidianus sulfidivorans JP7]